MGEAFEIAIAIKAVDLFSETFSRLGGIGKTVGIAVGAVTGLAVGMGEFAAQGAIAGDVQEAFNKVAGTEGPKTLQKMQDALLGTVDKNKLMQVTNSALSKGIKQESLPAMADFAQRLADSNPAFADTTGTLNDLSTAIATGKTKTLARMGIMVDADAAEQAYATSIGKTAKDLTDSEKAAALQMATMDALKVATEKLPKPMADTADMIAQLQTKFADVKTEMAMALEPAFQGVMTTLMDKLGPAIETIAPLISDLLSKAVEKLGPLIDKLIPVIVQLVEAIAPLIPPLMDLAFLIFNTLIDILTPFIPIIQLLAEIIGQALTQAMAMIMPYMPQIIELFGQIATVVFQLLEALAPLIPPLINLAFSLFPAVLSIITSLMPVIQTLIPVVVLLAQTFLPVIEALTPLIVMVTNLIALLIQMGADVLTTLLVPALQIATPIIQGIGAAMEIVIGIVTRLVEWITKLVEWISKIDFGKLFSAKGGGGDGGGKSKKVKDAIIRPNGEIIETHPRDTLIATQNPGALGGGRGITINIQSLVANDAQSVATTLQRLLLEKINI